MPCTSSLLGLLTWGLALSSAYAGKTTTDVSSASCTVVATGSTSKDISDKRAVAVKKVSQYLCDGKTKTTGNPEVIATDTATVWAEAVAAASIDCAITGTGSVKANAHAKAQEAARVWLEAYAVAVSKAEVCGKCTSYAKAQVAIHKEVLLKAVAEVNISVEKTNNDPNTTVKVTKQAYQKALVKASVTAFAKALATAKDDKNGVLCQSDAETEVTGPSSSAKCVVRTKLTGDTEVTNALAEAVAKVAVDSCGAGGLSTAKAEVAAQAVATAVAEAFGAALSKCTTTKNSYACVKNDGWIDVVAKATAKAVANGWFEASNCKCKVNADALVESLGSVISKAGVDVYYKACASGGATISYAKFKSDYAAASVKAIAKALVDAYATSDTCGGSINVDTKVCECVQESQRCVKGGKVVGCCDVDYSCIKSKTQRDSKARCRKNSSLKDPKYTALKTTCAI